MPIADLCQLDTIIQHNAASSNCRHCQKLIDRAEFVHRRSAIILALLFTLQSWSSMPLSEEEIIHSSVGEEISFRDIAVVEPFSHQTFADYSDVAVVINNQSTESRIIGTAFALARNISPERVFLLTNESTPTGETINSNQFTDYFSNPISQMISERNLTDLNVLVTTKGVPLRVNGGTNSRASFDSELALINGPYASSIFADWNVNSNYGLAAGNEMKAFDRSEQGYYLVTRLTGYDVETALGLITKTNNSFGQHGLSVLDLATNRNGSGYKWWNDLLYTTNETLTNMGFPVHFNQNSTYVTNMENVSMYAAWGSNDGSWGNNQLANSGYDTSDGSWSTGSRYWDGVGPSLSSGEQWWWTRQTETKRNGNAAMEGRLEDAPCGANDASITNGLLAEYFDNNGVSYNVSTMVNLSGRTPDFVRHEPNIDWPSTQSAWTGLDSRFLEYWSARHSGIIHIPTAGNWTFYLRSDDGSKLWIDDAEIVDNQGHHAMQERSGTVWLDAGEHHLRTEFFEHGGYAGLELKWEGPGISKQTVPNNVLTRGSSSPVREAELIHHWDFNEVSGDVANDSIGSAHLNFTGTNGSQWRTCVLGNCAFFDGIDDEARVDVDDMVSDFTVSMWIQANHSGQSRHSSAIAVNDVAGDDDSFQFQTSGGNPGNWELYHNNSYSFGTVDHTVWQHLVATFSNDTITLYMDGVEVLNQSVPNGTVNSIEIYKFGVNRAGNTHFAGVIDEVQIWETALNSEEVADVHDEIVWICPSFDSTNNSVAYVEQTANLVESGDPLDGNHAWVLDGYSMREGWVEGDWWLEVETFDANGTTLSINRSDTRSFSDDWQNRQLRFRPGIQATSFSVRQVAEFSDGTYNGSIFFDTLKLYPIIPHFTWLDGSIAETAVSTGGRTFALNSSYGQSLISDLLDDGVSGVKGYVYEPYLTAVSNPEQLLSCYADGYTMSECYAASNTMLSWMGTVVGDPKMAAFGDRLHDINISDVYAPNRLSVGENGTLEVLLENLAPGIANGFLEIRDRQNNLLLANHSLTLPGGNDAGSRLILPVNVTPARTGFVEFIVRWISADSHPERIVENNIALLNIEINSSPEIDEKTCSTSTASRGGVVICRVEVTDDFGISTATLNWRYNQTNSSYSSISASTNDGGFTWTAAISIPIDAPLTSVELHWIVYDIQNLSSEITWSDAFDIVDSSATWYGVHIGAVDLEPWLGIYPPVESGDGWIRGRNHTISACVIDIDHNPTNQAPSIQVDGIEIDTPTIFSTSGSQTCYRTIWSPEAGTPLQAVTISLYSDGIEWTNRTLIPDDLPPTAVLSLFGETFFSGVNDHIRVEILDEDDPQTNYSVDVEIEWPGAGTQSVDSEYTTAPPGLEPGDAQIIASISEGKWQGMQWTWDHPVFLTQPSVKVVSICHEGISANQVTRGVNGSNIWIEVEDSRSIQNAGIKYSEGDGIEHVMNYVSIVDSQPPSLCISNLNKNSQYFAIPIDSEISIGMKLGLISYQINVQDIDLVTGFSESSTFELVGSPPVIDLSSIPVSMVSGNEYTLRANITDSDGISGMECSVLIKDESQISLFSEIFRPELDGKWSKPWIPSEQQETNQTLYFTCLDETRESTSSEINLHIMENLSSIEAENNSLRQTNVESRISPYLAIVFVVALAILVVSLISINKRQFDEEEILDEELPDDAWSKSNSSSTDDELLEMAGLESSTTEQWTDEQLIAAGWTQAQVETYRNQNQYAEQDILNIIQEEE